MAAVLQIEDMGADFNKYYHGAGDTIDHMDREYFVAQLKALTAAIAHLAVPVTSPPPATPVTPSPTDRPLPATPATPVPTNQPTLVTPAPTVEPTPLGARSRIFLPTVGRAG